MTRRSLFAALCGLPLATLAIKPLLEVKRVLIILPRGNVDKTSVVQCYSGMEYPIGLPPDIKKAIRRNLLKQRLGIAVI